MSGTRAGLRWALAASAFLLIALLIVPLMLLRQGDSRVVEYLFYGVDEFITVVLQPDGTTKRVVNVVHVPDQGSPRERYRRRLEDRMR
jgi:hypothetical protein